MCRTRHVEDLGDTGNCGISELDWYLVVARQLVDLAMAVGCWPEPQVEVVKRWWVHLGAAGSVLWPID